MKLTIPQERLTRLIGEYAAASIEGRQVARRLSSLLLDRYRSIRRQHAGRYKGALADRCALTDPQWLACIEEFLDTEEKALRARIQYETHHMLFEARRSLRRAPFRS